MSAILCFGDSNTWGWREDGRFPRDVRWPGVLRSLIPAGWEVVEEGLGGRRASDALAYFDPCLRSHEPLDVVVLFLGVNDPDAETAAAGIRELVAHARAAGVPRVLVVAAPGLAAAFRSVCDELLDLDGRVAFRDDDPIHLDAEAHRALAHAVAKQLALGEPAVRELRVVVTAEDYDLALRFYRDVLGLREREAYSSPDGRVTILEAGAATLELADASQAAFIDRVEVGRRVAGHIRLAFEVADAAATTDALAAQGAAVLAPPTRTPWSSLNARLETPAGLQITLFEELG
jgi:lysophospholipase L1-like esterase/predicted enzyme related to lactoylglutathione lyase